jgi:hypothetical protein
LGSSGPADSPSRSAPIILPPRLPEKITRQRPADAKLRSWRVVIIRSKGEHLGTVEATDRERAEMVAIKRFDLDDDQRRRPLIRGRNHEQ